jgi:CBS domain-containing protein
MERVPSIVEDIMSAPLISVEAGVIVRDAALLMTDKNIGSIIVTDAGKPVGIVTERDTLARIVSLCRDPCETRIGEIMSSPLLSIPKEMDILTAMRKMREDGIRRLGVTDDGNIVGVITERDIIRAISISSLTSFSSLLRKRR